MRPGFKPEAIRTQIEYQTIRPTDRLECEREITIRRSFVEIKALNVLTSPTLRLYLVAKQFFDSINFSLITPAVVQTIFPWISKTLANLKSI